MPEKSKRRVSLTEFVDDPEAVPEEGVPIHDLVGPGVTIIGSEYSQYRFILQEQMAAAISTGKRFLDLLDTEQCGVLYVCHGPADYSKTRERLGPLSKTRKLNIRNDWKPIARGCCRELKSHKRTHSDFGVAFLGDFVTIRSPFPIWHEELAKTFQEKKLNVDHSTRQQLLWEMEVANIRRLRDVASELGISIILGHELTTQGKLRNSAGLHSRDTELRLRNVKGQYKLEVVPPSPYVPTNTWELAYDERAKLFHLAGASPRLAKKRGDPKSGQSPLNDTDIKILKFMFKGKPLLSVTEIEHGTRIRHSTVDQAVKRLETSKKGEWVVHMDGPRGRLYYADRWRGSKPWES